MRKISKFLFFSEISPFSQFFVNKSSFFRAATEEKTQVAGFLLASRLLRRPEWGRTLFLHGNLGSGKTTFTRGLSRGFSADLKIKSPSFNLISEHEFFYEDKKWLLVHADLFRLEKGAGGEVFSYLAEKMAEERVITVIEWAENLPDYFVKPPERIELFFAHTKASHTREIACKFFTRGRPSVAEVEALSAEFMTPTHVRAHEEGVFRVASFLAEKMLANGVLLDLELVRVSALLHDLVRIVNFKELRFADFREEITPEKVAFWEELRKKYGEMHHGNAAAEILSARGFFACADTVASHRSRAIFEEIKTFEEKIVYLADKKVLHDKIVKISERLLDGRERHGIKDEILQVKLETGIRHLAGELFALAGFADEEAFCAELRARWG